MAVPDRIRERFFHKDSSDQEFTTLSLVKLVAVMSDRIDGLRVVARAINEVANSSAPPARQQQRLRETSRLLLAELSWLDDMFDILQRTTNPE